MKKENKPEQWSIRDLFLNNLAVLFAAEKTDRDYLVHYSPKVQRAVKDIEIVKNGDSTFECRKYDDTGNSFKVIPYADIDSTTLAIWNQFLQKRMWSIPGVTYQKVSTL